MNKNIEKINSHLWLVNFDHIKAGYIDELKDIEIMNHRSTITIEGIQLVHRDDENAQYADNLAQWVNYLMGLKKWQLEENEAFKAHIAKMHNIKTHQWNDEILQMYVKAGNFEHILEFLNHASKTELERRKIVKNYKRNKLNPMNWLGRK